MSSIKEHGITHDSYRVPLGQFKRLKALLPNSATCTHILTSDSSRIFQVKYILRPSIITVHIGPVSTIIVFSYLMRTRPYLKKKIALAEGLFI